MSRQVIGIGTTANDGNGDPLRLAFEKCNGNFAEVYAGVESALEIASSGTNAANQALTLAQTGTASATYAGSLAYKALQTAWAGTNAAYQALQTAWAGTAAANQALSVAQNGSIGFSFVIDGGGAVVTTGHKGYVEIPYNMWLNQWTIVADLSGNAVIDVVKSNGYAGFPTTATIAPSNKPTLSGQQKNQNTTLATWTRQLNKGDLLGFSVSSASTVTNLTVAFQGTRN
jgi:hypothetical protein